jgi:hypothetical protein
MSKEIIPILKRHRISTHQAKFEQLKKEFLCLKWNFDQSATGEGSGQIKKDMEKVATLLFNIEHEFRKHQNKVN